MARQVMCRYLRLVMCAAWLLSALLVPRCSVATSRRGDVDALCFVAIDVSGTVTAHQFPEFRAKLEEELVGLPYDHTWRVVVYAVDGAVGTQTVPAAEDTFPEPFASYRKASRVKAGEERRHDCQGIWAAVVRARATVDSLPEALDKTCLSQVLQYAVHQRGALSVEKPIWRLLVLSDLVEQCGVTGVDLLSGRQRTEFCDQWVPEVRLPVEWQPEAVVLRLPAHDPRRRGYEGSSSRQWPTDAEIQSCWNAVLRRWGIADSTRVQYR